MVAGLALEAEVLSSERFLASRDLPVSCPGRRKSIVQIRSEKKAAIDV